MGKYIKETGLTGEELERYWSKVDVAAPGECWNWKASKSLQGYGQIVIRYKRYKAHRIAWYLANGNFPKKLCVCHHCDNPSCVNPDHLFLGSHQNNMSDASHKGRMSKLSIEDIGDIRWLQLYKWSVQDLAAEFCVPAQSIQDILDGKTWAWVE